MARRGYQSLLTRRRRRERRRRRAFGATVLGAGFLAGVAAGAQHRRRGRSRTRASSRLPAVAAAASDGSLLLARYESRPHRRVKRAAPPTEAPAAAPPPPVPADVLALLPPSARNDGRRLAGLARVRAEAPRDRVIERSESVGPTACARRSRSSTRSTARLTERVVADPRRGRTRPRDRDGSARRPRPHLRVDGAATRSRRRASIRPHR